MKSQTMMPFRRLVNTIPLRNSSFYKSHKLHHPATKVLYPLKTRGLVKVSGPEAAPFLQGLITNDMNHFATGAQSLYAMFLCNRGKVLYDTLIHKWGSDTDNIFMLECDKSVHYLLQQHLMNHEFKRIIEIEDVTELYRLWAMIAPPDFTCNLCETDMAHGICVYQDPRLIDLGHRLITTRDVSRGVLRQAVGRDTFIQRYETQYKELRYGLGVSEGAEDLFPGTYFPLEANCDYLGGVCFKKSYYVGQDVTDSEHRNGVRKRIMPIHFLTKIEKKEDLLEDVKVCANRQCGRNHVGTFMKRAGRHGIALLNIRESLEAKTLHIGSNPVEVTRPHWWSEEYSTEKPPDTETILTE